MGEREKVAILGTDKLSEKSVVLLRNPRSILKLSILILDNR